MPWSAVTVAILLAAIAFPYLGEYIAMVVLALSALIFVSVIPVQAPGPMIRSIAHATGINPEYVGPGALVVLIFALGLYCLVRALLERRWSDHAHAATILWGFLAITAVAFLRLSDRWPH
jgi:hypothetical protein